MLINQKLLVKIKART